MLLALLLAIFVLAISKAKIKTEGYHLDYLSKDKTNSIKGVFILLIVLTHSIPYITNNGYEFDALGDSLFFSFLSHLSQLVVVMFLFYSGYGVCESYKSKGKEYVRSFPRKRMLTTLLNFDVAVLVFIVLGLFLGTHLTLGKSLLSLTGWESVGNSNWYIFVILLCYLMTYLVLRLPIFKGECARVVALFALSFALIVFLVCFKESYWYNTILSYPLGFMLSTFKDPIEAFIKKNYWIVLPVVMVLFVLAYLCRADSFSIIYNLTSMLFAVTVVLVSMKMAINNKVLRWLGKNLFPIYIYMRLPMIVMDKYSPEFVSSQPSIFILVSLIVTILIAKAYKYWQIKL